MDMLLPGFAGGPLGIAGAIVEVFIIVALTYAAFRAMRGTRGAGVARGALILFILLFLVVLFLARLVHLENVRWILENLVGVSIFGLVVVFQPEIRRLLIRIGETASGYVGLNEQLIEKEITDAAFQISNRNEAGALIVIERKTQIGNYIDSGVHLDALVNSRLLITIFTKNTPLHDGAAIIRQGRIIAANCLLPLSENVEACRGMGTRHRAALGLSEETDAVVVIVSEETGKVSVAVAGKMEKDIDYKRLLEFLERECLEQQQDAAGAGGNGA